ncbi:MAG: hypothetical protein LUQ66_00360 [Methanoregula sp.]|nr:hypothetical protein [Methanoregula sp.]
MERNAAVTSGEAGIRTMTDVTEQSERALENGALPTSLVKEKAAGTGRTPDRDPKTPDAKNTVEHYQQTLDQLSEELDAYFLMRRLMPRE